MFLFFFQFEDHWIGKFSNNIDFRKLDFLSAKKDFQLMLLQELIIMTQDIWMNKI